MTIKGELKGFEIQGVKLDNFIQGFYIRNTTGLTNYKPSWTHEHDIGYSVWFDDASESWVVGYTKDIGSSLCLLSSSTSQDNSVPQEAKNWEYVDFNSDQWINSSDICIKRGIYYVVKLYL